MNLSVAPNKRLKKILCWYSIVFFLTIASAQEYRYRAVLPPIDSNGFYKIRLDPFVLGAINTDQSDIRILDEEEKEVPYFIRSEKEILYRSLFREYRIIEKNLKRDGISYLILHNERKNKINNISLVVSNTSVQKRARLSGSYDKINWFIIKEDYLLHSMYNDSVTIEFKILNFPLSDYEFYKIELNDFYKIPINIIRTGYYDVFAAYGNYQDCDPPVIIQKDSAKYSYVSISFPSTQYVEKLKISVEGADFYKRDVVLYHTIKIEKSERNIQEREVVLAHFIITSNSDNVFDIGGLKIKDAFLRISNNNDRPLIVKEIKATHLKKYLISKLDTGMKYNLVFVNEKAETPIYDISHFDNLIQDSLPVISVKNIVNIEKDTIAKEDEHSIFANKYLIWLALIMVGLLLFFLSVKLLRDINNNQKSDSQ